MLSPTSVAELTNALVVEWEQIPAARLQHLVESLPRHFQPCFGYKKKEEK